MFRFINHPQGASFMHGKLFTLEWQLQGYKWLLIRYYNGQRKKWYRRTERPYRFKTWFFGKRAGSFSNIANYQSPKIEVFLFRWYLAWPKKLVIAMPVYRLATHSFSVSTKHISQPPTPSAPSTKTPLLSPLAPSVSTTPQSVTTTIPHPDIQINTSPSTPICHWPVSDWIRQGIINDNNQDFHSLQELTNTEKHV